MVKTVYRWRLAVEIYQRRDAPLVQEGGDRRSPLRYPYRRQKNDL